MSLRQLLSPLLLLLLLLLAPSIVHSKNNNFQSRCFGKKLGEVTQSETFIPDQCGFIFGDVGRRDDKHSCCLKSDAAKFQTRLDNILNQTYSNLWDCDKGAPTVLSGYRLVLHDGQTPDLVTEADVMHVRDTRAHTQICQEHLMALQCIRCSVDHSTILGRKGTRVQPEKWFNKSIMAEHHPPQTIFFVEYPAPVPGAGSGEPMVLCETYYKELLKFCDVVTVRGYPLDDSYSADYFTEIPFGLISTGPSMPRNETIRHHPSPDGFDYLLTSDRNCYTKPLPKYEEPQCVYIVNNQWKADFDRSTPVVDVQALYLASQTSQLHPARGWASLLLPVITLLFLASFLAL